MSAPRAFRPASLVGLLLLAAAFWACPSPKPEAEPGPSFRLATLDGRQLGPADFPGKVVVLDFWATWCGPCHLQAEILKTIHQDFADRGVQILAVDVGEDEETVRAFVADSPLPYPVLLDPEDSTSLELDILGLPTLIVIDTQGRTAYRTMGVVQEHELRQVLAEAGV